jgi:hypothetical protein
MAAPDAAQVAGDLQVDGIHFSADGSVITKLSDAIGPQGIQGSKGDTGSPGASPFILNGSDAVYTTGSVGIGTNPPDTTAALDITSTSKGILAPRMTSIQRTNIQNPATGLTVYDTDNKDIMLYNGTAWVAAGNSTNPASKTYVDTALASIRPVRTPQQIAILDWYTLPTFSVGTAPRAVAFDGTNIWVANGGSNNVTKLKASDGSFLGMYNVGKTPYGIAFDGTNIWVINGSDNNVTKLKAGDGSLIGTYSVGTGPRGIAFDGSNIWVANILSNNVTKLNASDGSLVGTYPVGKNPLGVAFDGTSIWVANNGDDSVTMLNASDGSFFATYSMAVGAAPFGVAFDGYNIWVANNHASSVSKLKASDGSLIGTYAVGFSPSNIVFDGSNIWVTNFNNSNGGLKSNGTKTYAKGFRSSHLVDLAALVLPS